MKIILDAKRLSQKEEAHAYLKQMLGFPDYYGNNLDALFDCLTELKDVEVNFINQEQAGEYFARIYPVILDAAKENAGFRIDW